MSRVAPIFLSYWTLPAAERGEVLGVWRGREIWLLWPAMRRQPAPDCGRAHGQMVPGPDGPDGPPAWQFWGEAWDLTLSSWWPTAPPLHRGRPLAWRLHIVRAGHARDQYLHFVGSVPRGPRIAATLPLTWWPVQAMGEEAA